jgi:PAS domain S-box-containing protein
VRLHGPIGTGGPPPEILPPAYRALLDQLIEATAADDGDAEPVDVRLRGLDGTWHALTVAAANMLAEPAVRGIGLYAADTTRLYEAEQRVMLQGARLSTLIGALGVGILLQDPAQHIVLVNDAFTELFGVAAEPADLIGQPVTALVATNPFAEQAVSDVRGYELLERGEPSAGEEYTLLDGRIVERDYLPVQLDGATLGHLWVFRDVTEQSQIRRDLEENNQALAELATLKTEFIATASHELRTPLTSILTFAHLLEEPGAGPAEHARALGAITRNADRMLRLVDDLILLATLEAGTAPLRLLPVDVPELIAAAIETWRPVAASTGVTLEDDIGKGPRLSGDSRHLHQLVDTLVGTAVARTPRMGRVAISAEYAEPTWVITMACSGTSSGDHIFTRPGRHDDPAAAHSNALALLLSRAIVTRHGGELLSPNEQRGMVYIVRLPLVPPEPRAED